MKKIKERDIWHLEVFTLIAAVLAAVLCILFLFDLVQNHWFLNFILGLGALLNVSLFLLYMVKKRTFAAVLAGLLSIFFIVCLVFFNIS